MQRQRHYWTVIIPYVENAPTKWHPTESTGPFSALSRGNFRAKWMAHKWAQTHLAGKPYSLKKFYV
jgi:hypothetical protein